MIRWTGKKCILGLPISFTTYILTDDKLQRERIKAVSNKRYRACTNFVAEDFETGDIKIYTSDRTSLEIDGVLILKNIKNSKAVHIGVLNDD